jgi:signal transduction histidine kinase
MRIAEFIRTHPNEIETSWEAFAKSLSFSGTELSDSELRDHLREILLAMADDMASPQSAEDQAEKSKGYGIRGGALDQIAEVHARMRLNSGFNLEQAISEYRALRSSILFLWVQSQPGDQDVVLAEVTRFNETLDQAIAELVRRFADKSEIYNDIFLGILAHEVRNPLNVIQLSGQALEAGAVKVAQVPTVGQRILRGAGRIDRLMDDLIIVVRSRMRVPLPLAKTDTNLGEICEQALGEAKASHGDTVFVLEQSGDLNGHWDRERLAEVVLNLALNAVIHGSAKQVQIFAEDQGPEVVLRVANQGAPIPVEKQESIFDPFVHTRAASAAPARRGLGLGLFIVKEIVTGHDGTVAVTSTKSEGTIFTVRLPRGARCETES